MNKLLVVLALVLALVAMSVLASAEGVEVVKNPDSKTGYTAVFTYKDDAAKAVQLQGAFQFYRVNDIYLLSGETVSAGGRNIPESSLFTPETWEPGMAHINDAGYTVDMVKGEDGIWTVSLDLPCAAYVYQYIVTDANGESATITDPANIPLVNTMGASQARSQFYVPFDAEKQAASDDRSFMFPIEDESKRGEILWTEFEGLTYEGQESNLHQLMLYLPAGFDAAREEPYKVLVIAHGGGGEEGDWFHQGHIHNTTDKLIDAGVCEPFIIAAIDRSKGTDDENVKNIMEGLFPYLEKNYNASSAAKDRAFAGLSAGGKLGYAVYQYESDDFGYFGIFSSAQQAGSYNIADAVALGEPVLYLGCGYADDRIVIPRQNGRIPMGALCVYLDKIGVEYTGLVLVEGAHDWFVWQDLYKDFVETTLWK